MRILLLTIDYAPQTGGVPLLVSTIVNETRQAVDWRVVTSAPGDTDEIVQRGSGLADLARVAWRSRRWLAESDERLIVSAHVYLGPLAHAIGRATGTKVSTLAYGRELVADRPHQRAALRTLTSDHRVVTISDHSEQLLKELGVDATRRSWVPPEMRPQFPPVPESHGRPEHAALRLITVTRLAEGYKNLEAMLRAVAVLAPAGLVERCTIVGDGPRRPALERKIAVLGLADIVHLPGRLDDDELAIALAESHVGFFSSRHAVAEGGFEGFGIVVQELAAAGLPVVVGDAAGARDAANAEWALMVDPDDVRGWVNTIAELADDEPRRARLSGAAREWSQSLDSSQMAARYLVELTGRTASELEMA